MVWSSIVTLADVIEEFERPTVAYGVDRSKDQRVTLEYGAACSSSELNLEASGLLTLSYHIDRPEDRAIKGKSIPSERQEYFDARHGYLDMSSLGITGVELVACP